MWLDSVVCFLDSRLNDLPVAKFISSVFRLNKSMFEAFCKKRAGFLALLQYGVVRKDKAV